MLMQALNVSVHNPFSPSLA
uniref:Uncharacterized protein n=1 Tax=Rhizophora mucronata TaxID=61149 RepID=A0A2P2NCT0_RHIMU